MEVAPNTNNRWVLLTQSFNKTTGKFVFDSTPLPVNVPMYMMYQIDLKARTVNLIGYSGSVQHYVDEGKGPPAMPQCPADAAAEG